MHLPEVLDPLDLIELVYDGKAHALMVQVEPGFVLNVFPPPWLMCPCTSAPVLSLGVFGTNVWQRSGSFPHGLADERDLLYGIGPIPQNPGDLPRPHLHLLYQSLPVPVADSATYFLPFPLWTCYRNMLS